MSSILLDVCDALAADLNAHDFSLEFEAARSYADASYEFKTADDNLHCDVVPASELKTQLDDRGHVRYLATAFIILRRKFQQADIERVSESDSETRVKIASVDPYPALVEEVNEWLPSLPRLTDLEDAVWSETTIDAAVVHAHLRDWSQFTGIIRVTYEVPKALP